jgi:AraC-like DNA-binding protein
MSESTLMRTFQRVMKRSPIDHVIRVRVSRACDLLRQPEARITEVAFETGFQDSNYFARQFKKIAGVTPREFRARAPAGRRV